MEPVLGDKPAETPSIVPEVPETPAPLPGLGDTESEWHKAIPEDLKDAIDWSKFKTLNAALKSLADGERYRGRSVGLPADDATPEEFEKVFAKLRPASPDAYGLNLPTYGDTIEWTDDNVQWLKQTAHEIGMHPRQLQKFVDLYGARQHEEADRFNAATQEELRKLQVDFKDTWQLNVEQGNRALAYLGGDELLAEVRESDLRASPTFLRAVFKLGKMLAEDNVIIGEVAGAMNPTQADAKIKEIYADKSHPFWNSKDVGHKDAVDEVMRLRRLKLGV